MRLYRSLAAVVLCCVLASPAAAQQAVGISGGHFVIALDGLALTSLNGSSIVAGIVADLYLPTIMTGHTATNWTLGGPLAAGGYLITGLAQGTASGQAIHAGYSWTCGTGLTGCGDFTAVRTPRLADTAVTPGAYPSAGLISSFSVDQQGRLILAGSTADGSNLTGVVSAGVGMTGLTLPAAPLVGEILYISADNVTARAQANAAATVSAVCAYQGQAGACRTDGPQNLLFDAGLTLVAGNNIYLSATTAGRVTNVAPSATGQFAYQIGTLVDASGYNAGAGSAQKSVFRPSFILGPLP